MSDPRYGVGRPARPPGRIRVAPCRQSATTLRAHARLLGGQPGTPSPAGDANDQREDVQSLHEVSDVERRPFSARRRQRISFSAQIGLSACDREYRGRLACDPQGPALPFVALRETVETAAAG